jgi:hypothetical protein
MQHRQHSFRRYGFVATLESDDKPVRGARGDRVAVGINPPRSIRYGTCHNLLPSFVQIRSRSWNCIAKLYLKGRCSSSSSRAMGCGLPRRHRSAPVDIIPAVRAGFFGTPNFLPKDHNGERDLCYQPRPFATPNGRTCAVCMGLLHKKTQKRGERKVCCASLLAYFDVHREPTPGGPGRAGSGAEGFLCHLWLHGLSDRHKIHSHIVKASA